MSKKKVYQAPRIEEVCVMPQVELLQASQIYRIPGLEDEGGVNSNYHEHGFDNRDEDVNEPAFGELVWE